MLDEALLDSFDILWFARLVDDHCICLRENLVDSVVAFLNSRHPAIKWEIQYRGRSNIPFLDLCLTSSLRAFGVGNLL